MSKTVEVENIGPIKHITLEFPENGGIVVLRGRNGCGKSTTIAAVDNLVSGRGKLTVRDGELKGSVRGFGASITVGKTTRRSGADELEVVTLEGKYSVDEIVDPQIIDPAAADARRIKALVALARVTPSPTMFTEIFDGDETSMTTINVIAKEGEDLITVAGRIKRACEEKARSLETESEGLITKAEAELDADKAVDLSQAFDAEALNEAYTVAVRAQGAIARDIEYADRLNRESIEAKNQLDELKPIDPLIHERLTQAMELETILTNDVNDLISRLDEKRQDLKVHQSRVQQLHAEAETANTLAARTADLNRKIDTAKLCPVIPSEKLDEADDAVTAAREAVEKGAEVRKAMERIKAARTKKETAAVLKKQASTFRAYAARVDEPLAAIVSRLTPNLTVEAGRLVAKMEVDGRPMKKYFHDLSPGERCRLSFELAIEAVSLAVADGKEGFLTIDQELWGAMDPQNRRQTALAIQDAGLCAIAAEASYGELGAAPFDPEIDASGLQS